MRIIELKILSFLMLLCMTASCSMMDKSSSVIEEDKLYVTRKYVGNYLDYRHTTPDMYGNPDLIWITTTLDSIYGKISAFGKDCTFTEGDRLFLRRVLTTSGKDQKWIYQIENDASAYYMINEYQNHNNVIVKTWFNTIPENTSPYNFISSERLAQMSGGQTGSTAETNQLSGQGSGNQ